MAEIDDYIARKEAGEEVELELLMEDTATEEQVDEEDFDAKEADDDDEESLLTIVSLQKLRMSQIGEKANLIVYISIVMADINRVGKEA